MIRSGPSWPSAQGGSADRPSRTGSAGVSAGSAPGTAIHGRALSPAAGRPPTYCLDMARGGGATVIDLLDADVWRDLNGRLAAARAHGPVARTPAGQLI